MTATFGEPNAIAITFFLLFIVVSLGINVWASRRTRTTDQFYAADFPLVEVDSIRKKAFAPKGAP